MLGGLRRSLASSFDSLRHRDDLAPKRDGASDVVHATGV